MGGRRMRHFLLRTKRRLGRLAAAGGSRMARAKVVLKRRAAAERLGLGIAVESDEADGRVLAVRVEQVDADSPAARAGVQRGDRIVRVDGRALDGLPRAACLGLFQHAALITTLTIVPAQALAAPPPDAPAAEQADGPIAVDADGRRKTRETADETAHEMSRSTSPDRERNGHADDASDREDEQENHRRSFHALVGKFDASARSVGPTRRSSSAAAAPLVNAAAAQMPAPPSPPAAAPRDYEPVFPRNRESSVFELIRQFDSRAQSVEHTTSGGASNGVRKSSVATSSPKPTEESVEQPPKQPNDPVDDHADQPTTSPPPPIAQSAPCTLENLSLHERRASFGALPLPAAPHSPTTSESSSGVHSLLSATTNDARFLSPVDKETRGLRKALVHEAPTDDEVATIRAFLGADFAAFELFGVVLYRPRSYEAGSVGLILTAHPTAGHALVQRVVTAGIADKDERLRVRDVLFFVNHKFTGNVPIHTVREWLKAPSPHVKLIVGRPLSARP
ncbi:PDZ domain-containing protein [Aphelenchoides fujianensis]|nr:PDZ domain-containing protein [Aphelenchoides fujianensis]